jgi:two-component system sensor histidine kinase CssS
MVLDIDGVVMKSKSLLTKSMILIVVPILMASVLLIVVSKFVIKDYFRDESFKILEREVFQFDRTATSLPSNIEDETENLNSKRVETQPLRWSSNLVPGKSVQTSFIVRVEDNQFRVIGQDDSLDQFELDQIIGNETWPLEGEASIESETIFYSIVPVENAKKFNLPTSRELYHIAYISETYSSDLSKSVIDVFLIGLGILLIVVSGILFYVFKHMIRRLHLLEKGSRDIGKGDFSTRLTVEPYDEIGRLGDAMNHMSRQLELNQDEQADQFQMISHELKTPIMVMQGYMDALLHEQYPNGTKEASFEILNKELFKLERLTQDIIILNKLEYLSKNNVEMTNLSLRKLFLDSAERMNLEKSVEITVNGEMTLLGDLESWVRVIENVLSNNLRYAKSLITVELGEDIIIRNDGPKIDEHLLGKIKKPFVKGRNGGSGLGLTIITNILKLYHFQLELKNCDNGVEYIIKRV